MAAQARAKERVVAERRLIQEIVNEAMQKAANIYLVVGEKKAHSEVKDAFKQTEKRLSAYSDLKDNIEEYYKDIDDLRRESPGKSKDIVFYSAHGGGPRLSEEEIQECRIMVIRKKIDRDQAEIDEIDKVLDVIRDDEYYKTIEMKYFDGESDESIAEVIGCDPSTVRRNKNRLVRRLAVKLYGAAALG